MGPWDYVQNCNVYDRALPARTINQPKKKKKYVRLFIGSNNEVIQEFFAINTCSHISRREPCAYINIVACIGNIS